MPKGQLEAARVLGLSERQVFTLVRGPQALRLALAPMTNDFVALLKDSSLALGDQAVCAAFHPGWVRTDMGGAGADLDVAESAAGLRRTLAALTPADSGGFFNFDGQPIGW